MKKGNDKLKGTPSANDRQSGDQKSPRRKLLVVQITGALVLIGAIIFVLMPHRSKNLHVASQLQTGQRMEVEMILQSSWGWNSPDRVAELRVTLAGREIPVKKEAYFGLGPIDTVRGPAIAETNGFPEILAWGAKGHSLNVVHWKFSNYYFSEREIVRNRQLEDTHYLAPPSFSSLAASFPTENLSSSQIPHGTLTPLERTSGEKGAEIKPTSSSNKN